MRLKILIKRFGHMSADISLLQELFATSKSYEKHKDLTTQNEDAKKIKFNLTTIPKLIPNSKYIILRYIFLFDDNIAIAIEFLKLTFPTCVLLKKKTSKL